MRNAQFTRHTPCYAATIIKMKVEITKELLPLSMSLEGTEGMLTGKWGRLRPFLADRVAPCIDACPNRVPAAQFIKSLQQGDLEGAWERILEENCMPRVIGRICFHPCEAQCNRGAFDETIAINALERVVGDEAFALGLRPQRLKEGRKERMAVVGSGPAGLSCAYHLARLGYEVTIFEAASRLGGMLWSGIPEFRLPRKVLQEEIDVILQMGIQAVTGVEVGRGRAFSALLDEFDAAFYAPGAQRGIPLHIPGAKSEGVFEGVDFLRAVHHGQAPEPGRRPLIIGGGNTALDAARSVLRMGSRPVVIYRRSREEMPAFADELAEAEEEGIEIMYLTSPRAILEQEGRCIWLECQRNRLSDPGPDGRRRFVPVADSEFVLEGTSIIAAIGQNPELAGLPKGTTVRYAALEVDAGGRTGTPRLYAGGDAVDQPRSVVHAMASGKRAAMAMDLARRQKGEELPPEIRHWMERPPLSMARYLRGQTEDPGELVRPDQIRHEYFHEARRALPPRLHPEERSRSFREVTGPLPPEEASQEAERCFVCGICNTCGYCFLYCPDMAVELDPAGMHIVIDYDHCKGCLVCLEECPRVAVAYEIKP